MDGRIVGRAQPFAKVCPSSGTVKRAFGLVAWSVLEDQRTAQTLDTTLEEVGRRVAEELGITVEYYFAWLLVTETPDARTKIRMPAKLGPAHDGGSAVNPSVACP